MSISVFLSELKQAGISVALDGNNLKIQSRVSPIPADFITRLKAQKAELMAFLSQSQCILPEFTRVIDDQAVAASYSQSRLWVMQSNGANLAYNIALAHQFKGPLDIERFVQALTVVLMRHDVFYCRFYQSNGELWQVKSKNKQMQPLLRGSTTDGEHLVTDYAQTEFAITGPNLYRHGLYELDDNTHIYVLAAHHILLDGRSLTVLFKQIADHYNGTDDYSPAPGYLDYADWLRHPDVQQQLKKDLAYWLSELDGASYRLNLPPPPATLDDSDGACYFELPPLLTQQINNFAQQQQTTEFSVFYAAFKLLLSELSGQNDFLVGHPVESRPVSALADTLGYFANTVALRVDIAPAMSFAALVQKVHRANIDSLDYQAAPFDWVVEGLKPQRVADETPLYQSFFSYQGAETVGTQLFTGVGCEKIQRLPNQAKFALSLLIEAKADGAGVLWEFRRNHFSREQMTILQQRLMALLQQALASQQAPVNALSIWCDADHQLMARFNQRHSSKVISPSQSPLLMVEKVLKETPQRVAVVQPDGQSWSYRQLSDFADRIATQLNLAGLLAGDIVVINLKRSAELVAAQLAALRLGIIFAPFAPDQPLIRLNKILQSTQAKLCLCEVEHALWDMSCAKLVVADLPEAIDLTAPVIAVDRMLDDTAYVVHTSGSTGTPKGVAIGHRAMNNLLVKSRQQALLLPGEKSWLIAGEAFDAAILEIWLGLSLGATLYVPSTTIKADVHLLASYIEQHNLDSGFLPTAYLEYILANEALSRCFRHCRQITTGGAKLTLPKKSYFPTAVVDVYGPSENTVMATAKYYSPEQLNEHPGQSIGHSLANVQLDILSEKGKPLAPGIVGEIVIRGDSLANGYLNRPDLTGEAFVCDNPALPGRYYRTGDLAYLNEAAELVFMGRKDRQVQVRGFRVEPSEVESCINSQAEVSQSCVIYDPQSGQLRAFVCPELTDSQQQVLLAGLKRQLPSYMVPSTLISLPQMPLTSNDKVNEQQLLSLSASKPKTTVYTLSVEQQKVAVIFGQLLNLSGRTLSADDDFFALGGHSILAMKLLSSLHEQFGVNLDFAQFSRSSDVASLTALIEQQQGVGELTTLAPDVKRQGVAISVQQQALWTVANLSASAAIYNVQSAWRLKGLVQAHRLKQVLYDIYQAHDALHSRFVERDGQVLICADVQSDWQVDEQWVDVDELEQWLALERQRLFDLRKGPLFIARLLYVDQQEMVVQLNLPHIVIDGWSMQQLWNEVVDRYDQQYQQPALAFDFIDYLYLQQQDSKRAVQAYWLQRLNGYEPLPLHSLSPPQSDGPFTLQSCLESTVSDQLRGLSKDAGVTLFTTALNLFGRVISQYCGQQDIVISTPYANRNSPQQLQSIGYMVSLLPIRLRFNGKSIHSELKALQTDLRQDMTCGDFNTHELLSALRLQGSERHQPLQRVVFAWQEGIIEHREFDNVMVERLSTRQAGAKFDLMLAMDMVDGNVQLKWEFNPSILSVATVQTLQQRLIEMIKADGAPVLVQPTREKKVLGGRQLLSRFDQIVTQYGDHTALVQDLAEWSYHQLDQYSDSVAAFLQQQSVRPGERVGVSLRRGVELAAAILGIIKVGGVYVPLADDLSTDRVQSMAIACQMRFCIGERDTANGQFTMVSIKRALAADHGDYRKVDLSPTSPAYINFSSGTSGEPKGVECLHQGIMRLVVDQDYMVLDSDTKMLSAAALSFDAFTLEFWGPLLNGGQVGFITDEGNNRGLDNTQLAHLIQTRGVNTAWLTAALFNTLVDIDVTAFVGLRQLLVGGDVVSPVHVQRIYQAVANIKVINGYGPTENTTFTCTFPIPEQWPQDRPLPLGKAIAGTEVFILDQHQRLQPSGGVGEIATAGLGLCRGYLDPNQMKDKFVTLDIAGSQVPVYRTGDLGYIGLDDELYFLGRNDSQVKINGYRIELEAVNLAVGRCDGVRRAETLALTHSVKPLHGKETSVQLVAFVQLKSGVKHNVDHLATFTADQLPGYMCPTAYIEVSAMPLTTNGKLDRRALQQLWLDWRQQSVSHRVLTATEAQIADIWQQLFEVGSLPCDANFYQLGGNSLTGLQVQSMLVQQLGCPVPLALVMKYGQLSVLAQALETYLAQVGDGALEQHTQDIPATIDTLQPLSSQQMRLWLIQQANPNSAYNIPLSLDIPQTITVDSLSTAIFKVLQAWPVLNMQFIEQDGQVMQRPLLPDDWQLHVETIATEVLEARLRTAANEVFPLQQFVSRWTLLKVGDERQILLFNIHHICFDGHSLLLLLNSLDLALQGRTLPVASSFDEFVSWQQGAEYRRLAAQATTHWASQLVGYRGLTALQPDLSGVNAGHQADHCQHVIGMALLNKTKTLAMRCEVTDYTLWYSVLAITLARLNGQTDQVIATPVANRGQNRFNKTIGFFANTLLIRQQIDQHQPFIALMNQVQSQLMSGLEHQCAPLEKVVEASLWQASTDSMPLSEVLFSHSAPIDCYLGGQEVALNALPCERVKYDIALTVSQHQAHAVWKLQYNADKYSRHLAETFLSTLSCVLAQVCDNPESPMSQLALVMPTPTQHPVLAVPTVKKETNIVSIIRRQGAIDGRRTALLNAEHALDFDGLLERSQRVAARLQQQGVTRGSRVAVLMERTVDLPVTLMGVLMAGATYIPLDPAYPQSRTAHILKDATPEVVVVSTMAFVDDSCLTVPVITSDKLLVALSENEAAYVPVVVEADDIAYIIYTSGSTGQPKGVAVRHGSIVSLFDWASQQYNAKDFDRVYAGTSVCFDLSVFELFISFAMGGTVYLANNTLSLVDDCADVGVTLINTVPSVLAQVIKFGPLPACVQVINLAGEALQPSLVKAIVGQYKGATLPRIFNLYGPSEDTVYSTSFEVNLSRADEVLIGKPIPGTKARVMDNEGRLLPDGFVGELYLSGEGLAQGYWGRADLTAERFVTLNDPQGERCYKTGDLVRRRADGQLAYIGRSDDQLKRNGFRIEPGEIDGCLMQLAAITSACTVVLENEGQSRLVAVIVSTIDASVAKAQLIQQLPAYMMPDEIVVVDEIPLTPSGKQDKQALLVMLDNRVEDNQTTLVIAVNDRDSVAVKLANIWHEITGNTPKMDSVFLHVGTSSMDVMRLKSQIHQIFGHDISVSKLFKNQQFDAQLAMLKGFTHSDSQLEDVVVGDKQKLQALVDELGLLGANVAVYNGKDVNQWSLGFADEQRCQLMDGEQRFRVSCISKVLMSYAALRMVDQGLFQLDTPLVDWVDDFTLGQGGTRNSLSLRHLLSHTAGFDETRFNLIHACCEDLTQFVTNCCEYSQLFAPGEQYIYSASSIIIVAWLLERVTGFAWREVIQQQVLTPLDITLPEPVTLANSYVRADTASGFMTKMPDPIADLFQPSAIQDICLTARELLNIAIMPLQRGKALDGSTYLSPGLAKLLIEPQVYIEGHYFIHGWALGYLAFPVQGMFGFITGSAGQQTCMVINRNRREAFVAQTNTYPNFEFFDALVGHFHQLSLFKVSGCHPAFELEEICGHYQSDGFKAEVYQKNNQIRLKVCWLVGDGGWSEAVDSRLVDSGMGDYFADPKIYPMGDAISFHDFTGLAAVSHIRVTQKLFKKIENVNQAR